MHINTSTQQKRRFPSNNIYSISQFHSVLVNVQYCLTAGVTSLSIWCPLANKLREEQNLSLQLNCHWLNNHWLITILWYFQTLKYLPVPGRLSVLCLLSDYACSKAEKIPMVLCKCKSVTPYTRLNKMPALQLRSNQFTSHVLWCCFLSY